MKSYFLFLIALAIVMSSFSHDAKPGTTAYLIPATQDSIKLSCVLSADRHSFMLGEGPDFNVSITNLSNHDIYLIGSLDGSVDRARMPYCYFTVEHPGADTFLKSGRHCGLTNTLQREDFILVKKGESFNPYSKIDGYRFAEPYELHRKENFTSPGTYKVRFHYSTMSADINKYKGYGDIKPELSQMLAKVPKVELLSNELEIMINK